MTTREHGGPLGAVVLVATIIAIALTLVVHVSPWVRQGFGVSHDGFNASVWALGGRGARADPIGNRLGGVQPSGRAYANHPPLVVWTTSVTGGLSDERPAALRAPALLASLAALALLARILLDAGFRAVEAAAGLAVAGTTGMFLTFGAMLDTPVVGLPFGLAALVVAQRAGLDRGPPPAVAALVGLLAGVAAWSAVLLAGLAVVAALALPGSRGSRSVRWLAGGLTAGVAVTLAWVAWVQGGLGPLTSQASTRSGTAGDFLGRQATFSDDLYGPAVLAITVAGVVLGLASPRPAWSGPRPLVAVVGGAVLLYTVGFREGATVHQYWTYALVALVALGATAVVAAASNALRRRSRPIARIGATVLVLAVAGGAGWGAGRRSDADRDIQAGLRAVPVLAAAPRASSPDEVTLTVRGAAESGAPWASYATGGRVDRPTDAELLEIDPDRLVFLMVRDDRPAPEVRAVALAVNGPFVLLRAGDYQRIVR